MKNGICVNKTINDLESGAKYLILWIAPGNESGYWYDLNSGSRTPGVFIMDDVVAGVIEGRFEVEDYSTLGMMQSDELLTDKERSHRDCIWNIMQTVVECEPDIYDGKLRLTILRKAAAGKNIDPTNLYRWLDRYWRSGKTKNAFIPGYSNSGAKGKERTTYKKNPSGTAVSGKTLEDTDRRNFAAAVKQYYLTPEKVSFKTVYEKLLQDFYTVKAENGASSGKLKLLSPNELPSLRQFQYWYSKNRDLISEKKKRDGESKFALDGRSVLGKADYGLMGPGAQYQIDATIGDIYLVSQFDRSNLIGRPVMYFVIDAFSRIVTGMGIGLEGPSWGGAMTAIANMAADKEAFCEKYGIKIDESQWPCHYVPASLLGDRGEMESKNADNLVNMLGIRIVNAPPYRADLKGIIEQHFRTINTNSVALLPGSVKPDMSKRGGRDYRLDAALDIRQFTQIVIKCVLYYNNHHVMDYFEKSEAMIKDNVEAIPARIWEWGIQHCSGALRFFPEDQVRLAVMPAAKATVTAKGIRFKGILYNCDRAVREAWFEKARSGKTWQITVSYDSRDMENIYIWDQDNKTYNVCFLLEWNEKYAGKCLDEIVYEQQKEKFAQKQLKLAETEEKVNLNADIDAIVSAAKDMTKGLPAKSKKERVSQIKENRKREREAMRSDSSEDRPGDAANRTGSDQMDNTEEEISPTLRLIKQKLEERLKND